MDHGAHDGEDDVEELEKLYISSQVMVIDRYMQIGEVLLCLISTISPLLF